MKDVQKIGKSFHFSKGEVWLFYVEEIVRIVRKSGGKRKRSDPEGNPSSNSNQHRITYYASMLLNG
ncbi:MAG: hypothetical protein M3Y76_11070 [Chloroflexota bacterium]|nr:hypothetical protein [Chloroflexota bacterium]